MLLVEKAMDHLLEHFSGVMTIQQSDREINILHDEPALEGGSMDIAASGCSVSPCLNGADDVNGVENGDEQVLRFMEEVKRNIYSDSDADSVKGPNNGFVVGEADGMFPHAGKAAPPPYTSLAPPGGSPFNYTAGVSHATKPPPPSFEEAIATTPPLAAVSVELSPLAAHYIPPVSVAQHDVILLRNEHGVFLLRPIPRPTPPYTPATLSSPVSPLPHYVLPPAAPPHFLGSSLAQAGGLFDAPKKPSASPYNAPRSSLGSVHDGAHLAGGVGAYTFLSTSVKSRPAVRTPPPPYPSQ